LILFKIRVLAALSCLWTNLLFERLSVNLHVWLLGQGVGLHLAQLLYFVILLSLYDQ